MVLKTTIAAGMLTGGLVLGSLVTYNGGSIVQKAQTKITQQASALNIFKTQQQKLVDTLTAKKAQLADLQANGTAEDQKTIDDLTKQIADIQANVDAGSDQVANRINDLEAEVNKANDDAAALDATVTAAGETATPMLQSQMDQLTDSVPEGYALLKMISGTPQPVIDQNTKTATKLIIDKTDADLTKAHLIVMNQEATKNFTVTVNGQTKVLTAGETYDFGLVTDFDGKTMTVLDGYGMSVGQYYLMAQ